MTHRFDHSTHNHILQDDPSKYSESIDYGKVYGMEQPEVERTGRSSMADSVLSRRRCSPSTQREAGLSWGAPSTRECWDPTQVPMEETFHEQTHRTNLAHTELD